MNVMLIDDDPFWLKLLSQQMEKLGYPSVAPYSNALRALTDLEGRSWMYDLIVCDLQMPEMNGIEFLSQLALVDFQGRLILVSGEDERILAAARQLAEAKKLKIAGALHKPISLPGLRQVIEQRQPELPAHDASTKNYLPEELLRAITNGELMNHYQPQVDMATGDLLGFEALVRWQHPTDGVVLPSRFIPLAEEHGLINALTRHVMTEALRQIAQWQTSGLATRVAVNVSMENLDTLEFLAFIDAATAGEGVLNSNLVVEITESQTMRRPLIAMDILTRLRLKKIGLSIDDFGTGHSSLVQLRDVPFDELKIDGSFVHGVADNASCQAIVEASVTMARKLKIKTVAEGVEDRADWDWVRNVGCDVAQGFFIGKAMPAQAVSRWMADWRSRCPIRQF